MNTDFRQIANSQSGSYVDHFWSIMHLGEKRGYIQQDGTSRGSRRSSHRNVNSRLLEVASKKVATVDHKEVYRKALEAKPIIGFSLSELLHIRITKDANIGVLKMLVLNS